MHTVMFTCFSEVMGVEISLAYIRGSYLYLDKVLDQHRHCGSNSTINVFGSLLRVSHFTPSHRQTSFTTWRVKLFCSARHTPETRKHFYWTLASRRLRTRVTGTCPFARGSKSSIFKWRAHQTSCKDSAPPPQAEGQSAGPQYRDGHPGRGHAQRVQVPRCGRRTVRAHPQGGDTRREGHLLPGLG